MRTALLSPSCGFSCEHHLLSYLACLPGGRAGERECCHWQAQKPAYCQGTMTVDMRTCLSRQLVRITNGLGRTSARAELMSTCTGTVSCRKRIRVSGRSCGACAERRPHENTLLPREDVALSNTSPSHTTAASSLEPAPTTRRVVVVAYASLSLHSPSLSARARSAR